MTGPIILLILTVITAEGRPDIVIGRMQEPSIGKCLEDAAAFFAQGIQRKAEGAADGLSIECKANAVALKADDPT